MHDPMMQDQFAKLMWQFDPSAGCSVDAHLDELTSHIKASAKKAYGRPVCAPRKPWISASTWSTLQHIAPLRRVMRKFRAASRNLVMECAFVA
eukprot:9237688-Heterocapsa_arctica.AAC.1